MQGLPWFRMYVDFLDDPIVRGLAFGDQRHFVFVLCMKCEGLLDREFPSEAERERAIAQRLGLLGKASEFTKRRLVKSGLIDDEWQPRFRDGWE